MPPLTHALTGWCIGNLVVRDPRQRFACIVLSVIPDVDGLGILASASYYQRYHHILAHNLAFAILSSLVAYFWTKGGHRVFAAYLLVFHLHLLMDLFGSGPGWGLAYFWPFSMHYFESKYAWSFNGWQNYATLTVLLLWTIGILYRNRRTPFEFIAPRFDALLLRPAIKAV